MRLRSTAQIPTSFSVVCTSGGDARSAGSNPNSSPVTMEIDGEERRGRRVDAEVEPERDLRRGMPRVTKRGPHVETTSRPSTPPAHGEQHALREQVPNDLTPALRRARVGWRFPCAARRRAPAAGRRDSRTRSAARTPRRRASRRYSDASIPAKSPRSDVACAVHSCLRFGILLLDALREPPPSRRRPSRPRRRA